MAQVKRSKPTKRAWSGAGIKPPRMKADKPVARKPKVTVVPDTREDLLRQIGVLFDKVDAVMAERKLQIGFRQWDRVVGEDFKAVQSLVERLHKLLGEDESSRDVVRVTFSAAPGTVPSWSRPGTFLLWIGYIPCRCIWGGFSDPCADIVAVDPAEKWMVPGGSISGRSVIEREDKTVDAIFRDYLTQQTTRRHTKYAGSYRNGSEHRDLGPAFELHKLSPVGRESTEKELARPENAWLVAALKRGPVDAIPLPPHLAAVQMTWLD